MTGFERMLKFVQDKLVESIKKKLNESIDYSGSEALYKVYHDIERNIDPSPEDIFEALNMMEEYYEEYLEWYDKHAGDKVIADKDVVKFGTKKVYEDYGKRLQEIKAAKTGKDPAKAVIVLDRAICQLHMDETALATMMLDVEDLEMGTQGERINQWLEGVAQILIKLGKIKD